MGVIVGSVQKGNPLSSKLLLTSPLTRAHRGPHLSPQSKVPMSHDFEVSQATPNLEYSRLTQFDTPNTLIGADTDRPTHFSVASREVAGG
jgi:hypothetical protein